MFISKKELENLKLEIKKANTWADCALSTANKVEAQLATLKKLLRFYDGMKGYLAPSVYKQIGGYYSMDMILNPSIEVLGHKIQVEKTEATETVTTTKIKPAAKKKS